VVAGGAQDRRVDGRLHQHALAGPHEPAQRLVEAGDHPGQRDHGLGRDPPAVALGHTLGDHAGQLVGIAQVSEEAVLDAIVQRLHHRRRRGEVHVRDPQRQDVSGELAPLVAVGVAAVDDAVEVEVGHGAQG